MSADSPTSNAPDAPPGWRWETLAETDSTNRIAQERILAAWANGSHADHLALRADRQTAGRGQHGRRWESPPGGLYISLVFENVSPELRARLALIAGMGVLEALHETCQVEQPLQIRWPNDVLLAGRKVAGILCQAVAQGGRWAAIVGIGINVNTAIIDLPPSLQDAAASLAAATGKSWNLDEIARACTGSVEHWLNMSREFGIAGLVQCINRLDALHGRPIHLDVDGRIIAGTGAGLSPDGALLLQLPDGRQQAFDRGSVQ